MRVLLVAPVEQGSGEIVTCLHAADALLSRGHDVRFLASALATRYFEPTFGSHVRTLTQDGPDNVRAWQETVRAFRPDAIVFADYPLLHFQHGTTPLVDQPGWVDDLLSQDACLVTFDHFGFAQEEMGLFFGPRHLSFFYQRFPAIPSRMRILLPCPMHEPGPVEGRRGSPFRYWDVPLTIDSAARRQIRRRYLAADDDWLIVHSVPNWAWRQAEAMGLPFYSYLGAILDRHLRDLPRKVTIVSVNNGILLKTPHEAGVRIVNLEPLPTREFEALMFSADLVLTENSVSIAMGKAICALQPCAALVNSFRLPEVVDRAGDPIASWVLDMERERMGAIYPYRVFPTAMIDELEHIVLYRDNAITSAFASIELFDAVAARQGLRDLLSDTGARGRLRERQRAYVSRLAAIGDVSAVLEATVTEARADRVPS